MSTITGFLIAAIAFMVSAAAFLTLWLNERDAHDITKKQLNFWRERAVRMDGELSKHKERCNRNGQVIW